MLVIPPENKQIIEKIKKSYEDENCKVSNIEYIANGCHYPYYKVTFSIDKYNCEVTCPIEIEDYKFYHFSNIWNSDVCCEVKINDKIWNGIVIPDLYGIDIEKRYHSIKELLDLINSTPDHYESIRKIFCNGIMCIASMTNEDLAKLKLEKYRDFKTIKQIIYKLYNFLNIKGFEPLGTYDIIREPGFIKTPE